MAVTDDGSLAKRLRALREAAGFSQEELAERAGLSSHAISALERGTRTRPYPHTVRALCDALGADADARAALIAAVPARARTTGAPGDSAATRRSLPVPATALLGRDQDLARATDLVREQRLVTLTGFGGVGKTRLALAVAAALQDRFADGVAYVELAPLREAGEVLPAIADAVDAPVVPRADAAVAVVERLRHQRTLLVLDNVEHLLEVAPRIAALIEAVPGLTVLATSRAPLRIRGEIEVAVEPLDVSGTTSKARQPACCSSAPTPSAPGGERLRGTVLRSRPCVYGWRASRWHWSWPQPGLGCSTRLRCSIASTSLCWRALAIFRSDSARCAPLSTGAMGY